MSFGWASVSSSSEVALGCAVVVLANARAPSAAWSAVSAASAGSARGPDCGCGSSGPPRVSVPAALAIDCRCSRASRSEVSSDFDLAGDGWDADWSRRGPRSCLASPVAGATVPDQSSPGVISLYVVSWRGASWRGVLSCEVPSCAVPSGAVSPPRVSSARRSSARVSSCSARASAWRRSSDDGASGLVLPASLGRFLDSLPDREPEEVRSGASAGASKSVGLTRAEALLTAFVRLPASADSSTFLAGLPAGELSSWSAVSTA